MCYAQVQGLELGEEKLPKPSGRVSNSLVLSPCLTAAANMGAQWLPWQPRGPLAANSPAPALSQVNRHLLVNPDRGQLQMAPMTPFDTIILSATNGSNDPI